MIKAKSVTYQYQGEGTEDINALSAVDIEIAEGEFVAIIGPNGSGKSTLARLFNALILPQSGWVRVDDMDSHDPANLWEIRRRVGMVYQNPDNGIVATSVERDVAFGLENLGLATGVIRERLDWALRVLGITDLAEREPNLLSGGQKQKVAIAGVLAMQPRYLVLDEPTALLDPSGRDEVMEVVGGLNRKGLAIVYITHFMDEAAKADRVVVMDRGRIELDGPPREVFGRPTRLKELNLDVPEIALLAEELSQAGMDLPSGSLSVDELVDALVDKN